MTIKSALKQGLATTVKTKRYIFFAWFTSVFFVLGPSFAVLTEIEDSLGSSLTAQNMNSGFDGGWYQNFSNDASDLSATFSPSVTGMGAVFDSFDDFVRNGIGEAPPVLLFIGLLYLFFWSFWASGFIGKIPEENYNLSFLQAAATYFSRFFVITSTGLIFYGAIFAFLSPFLTDVVNNLTSETLDERFHFFLTVLQYLILWSLIWAVNIVFDYCKILTVLQNRKNVFAALVSAVGLVFANFKKTAGLYFTVGGVWLLAMIVYWIFAPGAKQETVTALIIAFGLGQLYIIARIWVRSLFYASQTALCDAMTG